MSAHRVSGIDALPCAAWAFTQLHHYRGWPCFTPPEPAPYRAGEHRHDSTSEETRISRPYDVIPAQDLLNPLGRMLRGLQTRLGSRPGAISRAHDGNFHYTCHPPSMYETYLSLSPISLALRSHGSLPSHVGRASLSTALRTGRREQRRTGKAADRGASHPENHCAFDLLILPQTQAVWEFPPGPRYVCKTIPNSQDPEPRQDAWDKARGIRSLGQRFCRTGSHASKELAGKEAAETRVRGGGGGGAEAAHLRAPTFLTSAPGHVIGRPNWKLADSDVSIRGGWGNTAGMREKLWAESGVVGRRSSLDQSCCKVPGGPRSRDSDGQRRGRWPRRPLVVKLEPASRRLEWRMESCPGPTREGPGRGRTSPAPAPSRLYPGSIPAPPRPRPLHQANANANASLSPQHWRPAGVADADVDADANHRCFDASRLSPLASRPGLTPYVDPRTRRRSRAIAAPACTWTRAAENICTYLLCLVVPPLIPRPGGEERNCVQSLLPATCPAGLGIQAPITSAAQTG
ncbi:unnamed protein product [Diplocarpon coronariae]